MWSFFLCWNFLSCSLLFQTLGRGEERSKFWLSANTNVNQPRLKKLQSKVHNDINHNRKWKSVSFNTQRVPLGFLKAERAGWRMVRCCVDQSASIFYKSPRSPFVMLMMQDTDKWQCIRDFMDPWDFMHFDPRMYFSHHMSQLLFLRPRLTRVIDC